MKWISLKDSTTEGTVDHNWMLVEQRLTAISGVQNRLSVACSTQHPLEVQNKHLPIGFQERGNYTIANVDEAIGWLQKLASGLNQQMNNVDKSVYIVFKINGEQKVLRIANHRGNAREFADRGEFKGNLGIVIKMDEKQFQADNRVEYKEQVFFPDKLDDSKLDQIISGAKHFIQTGEYNGPSGDQINISPKQSSQATSKQSNKQIEEENTMKWKKLFKEGEIDFDVISSLYKDKRFNRQTYNELLDIIEDVKNGTLGTQDAKKEINLMVKNDQIPSTSVSDIMDEIETATNDKEIREEDLFDCMTNKVNPQIIKMVRTMKKIPNRKNASTRQSMLWEEWFDEYGDDVGNGYDWVCVRFGNYIISIFEDGQVLLFEKERVYDKYCHCNGDYAIAYWDIAWDFKEFSGYANSNLMHQHPIRSLHSHSQGDECLALQLAA